MESFVHLRKGVTPRRLHADLDGLKDDELGRGGFTGRTANLYRRHDPTAYRTVGPLRPLDVLSSELKPADATSGGRNGDATLSPGSTWKGGVKSAAVAADSTIASVIAKADGTAAAAP